MERTTHKVAPVGIGNILEKEEGECFVCALLGKKKSAMAPLKPSSRLSGLSGPRRLIAMRFRIEAGSRQHLENESLVQNKELFEFQQPALSHPPPYPPNTHTSKKISSSENMDNAMGCACWSAGWTQDTTTVYLMDLHLDHEIVHEWFMLCETPESLLGLISLLFIYYTGEVKSNSTDADHFCIFYAMC